MIAVAEALDQLFALVPPMQTETVALCDALGRVLANDAVALRDQPPFAASAMDGYAVTDATPGATLTVIGASAAGHGFDGSVGPGQAVRIFTGAPLPQGATRVIIQEDVTRSEDRIVLGGNLDTSTHIRPAGNDFTVGARLSAPRQLAPNDIALLASMNIAHVQVTRRPVVALIATGDELVMPGEPPGPDQIVASNSFGLFAHLIALGAEPRLLPIARDTPEALRTVLELARGADLIITIGGASVGDHDLVAPVTASLGMQRAFYKVAMRPGKPLMAGRLGQSMLIGLPGNPVSAMVCGHVFVAPVVRAMLGLEQTFAPRRSAFLAEPLPTNGPREHYMRARIEDGKLRAFDRQDSALLSVLAQANALIVRPPNDPARAAGALVEYLGM
ncbi:gephyrin-like molybdotransferase Glp [Puniceibacterium sp. IMCC21224]|uniref:molybdopterin molybdotransferase MoeA n=1 Tax=Puniceibacterium sp. IMCC21224 TaxID=1618204 RepID=UPI00064DD0E5|nr:gephyrin-like molybdotransferase Glp [Puniceibacterium sp. IMCC21224]KMK67122.1 molybdopterin biosynthesis enzyme [Puniceibacterium sp. IMCC21224]